MAVIIFLILFLAWKGILFTYHCYTLGKMRPKVKELLMLYSELSYTKILIIHRPLRHNGSMVLKNLCSANFSAVLILSGRKIKQQNYSLKGQQLAMFNLCCCSVQTCRCRNVFRSGDFFFFWKANIQLNVSKSSLLLCVARNWVFCYYFRKPV